MLNLFFFKFLHIPWRILNLDFFFKVFHSIHYYITKKSSSTPDRYLLFSMNKIFLFTARSCKKKTIQTVHTVIRSMFYFIVISLTRRRKRKRFGDSVVSDNYKYLNYKYTILLQTQTLTLISLSTFATMFEVSLRFLERF